mgnify:CR=1 FL=1
MFCKLCTLCGREIPRGRPCWTVNGRVICEACFPGFARAEDAPYRGICGEGARR